MRILFAGTPECAVQALKAIALRFELCGILTNPPAPIGRSKKLQDSCVAKEAKLLKSQGFIPEDIPVLTPEKLDLSFRQEVIKLKPDILVCFAYGKIFGPKTMALFRMGGINVHPSLLPRWRGASPVPAAILSGDKKTGITIQTISPKPDSGDILTQTEFLLDGTETSESLLSKCAELCCKPLIETLLCIETKLKEAEPQNEKEATYCSIIQKDDGLINWSESAEIIYRKIRAFTPWPGCFSYKNGEKINIISASLYNNFTDEMTKNKKFGTILGTDKKAGILVLTGSGVLAVSVLQRQTKNKLFWKDFINGLPDFINGSFESKI